MYIKTSDQEKLELGFGNWVCNWGLHIAGLYSTEAERDGMLIDFLHKGAEDGDLQLYCPAEQTKDEFEEKFSRQCPCCKDKLKDQNVFQFFTKKQLYYPDGKFSPWVLEDTHNSFFEKSQQNGRRNVRATAEMVWALEHIPDKKNLMAYESRLNYFIPGKPWVSLCLYNITKFSGDVIMGVLKTHPFTISGKVITENPYYINPDEYLAKHAPEFLQR